MQVRWRQFECPACEAVQRTQSERKVLASILLCDKEGHLVMDCENSWECPATSAINQIVQLWSQCPFHGALENHFARVREMRGRRIVIEARKVEPWNDIELNVWSFSGRTGRVLYQLRFLLSKHRDTVWVYVNNRDELFILPLGDFLNYAPKRWVEEVLKSFTSPPKPEAEKVSATEEVR